MTRRYLALHLPSLALDRLRRRDPALRGRPLATFGRGGDGRGGDGRGGDGRGARRLVAVQAPGLHPGQAVADARAIHPDLALRPDDPAAVAALLRHLALWCLRWTPLAAVDGPDGLMLDITGTDHLFGGEPALLGAVVAGLAGQGFACRGAIAGVAGCAAALTRGGGRDGLVLPPGTEAASLAPLGLAALRLEPELLVGLGQIGLRRVGDVLAQPRAAMARRFGVGLLDALDDATGSRPRPRPTIRPAPAFAAARLLAEPLVTRPAIEALLDLLLAELCAGLAAAGRGGRRLLLRAFRVDGAVQEIAVGTAAPSRAPEHLARLFAERLERLAPGLGFERISLEATATDPMPGAQPVLGSGPGPVAEGSLCELIDRLGQRVRLSRPRPTESHWPERSAAPGDPLGRPAVPLAWAGRVRPVRLLARPLGLAVATARPDGPPLRLRHGATCHRVLRADGPERLEPEWWGADAARPARDYYRVQTAEGPRLWVCRLIEPGRAPRWFLHGELA